MQGNRLARVVGVHPEAFAVDLIMLDDGSRLAAVQVLSPSASTNAGLMDMIKPDLIDDSDKFKLQETKTRDIYAVVAYAGHAPYVQGFLFPQVCQMLFKDINRRINRHPSDVYTSLNEKGDFELYHPSGTYFRIATDSAHEDLTGKDFDKKWKIEKNTDATPRVHLEVWNGGAQKAAVDLDKDGNVALTNIGTLTSTTTGNVTAKSTNGDVLVEATNGNITAKANSTITLDAPTIHVTGDINCDKTVTATTNVIGGGKSLKTHTHSGVQPGAGTSGPPS